MTLSPRFVVFLCACVFAGCGDDATAFDGGPDAGDDAASVDAAADGSADDGSTLLDTAMDVVAAADAGADASETDGGALDAGGDASVADAGPPIRDAGPDVPMRDAGDDAGRDAGPGACHAYTFGRDAVRIEMVAALPTMTGGSIPLATYDAFSVQTTGTTRGTYRGTWVFESADTLQTIEQLDLSGAPPAPTPRTQSYRTGGIQLRRARTCGGDETFDNQYTVREEDGRTFLDIRSGSVMFTFLRRP